MTDVVENTSEVTREDAIKFLEGACRNWSHVPRLSEDDISDVAVELERFTSAIAASEKQTFDIAARLLKERDAERDEVQKLSRALRKKDEAMGVLFQRMREAGVDYSDLLS